MYNYIDIKRIGELNLSNNSILLDIRDKYEYILGNIPGSINIPYLYILTIPQNYLKFDTIYYIYCDNGVKSKKICNYLNELGYKTVDLVGGYKEYLDGR